MNRTDIIFLLYELIDSECFCNNEKLTSIDIPQSCKKIARGAFDGCKELKTLRIPKDCDCPKKFSKGPTEIIRY